MTSLILPKGSSLERRTIDLFAAAGLPVQRRSEASYRGRITYHEPIDVSFYKPREIPSVIEAGYFDFGLTGADWVEDAAAQVECVSSFSFGKALDTLWRLVLAVPEDHPARCVADLPESIRVATEYTRIGAAFFADHGRKAEIVRSYGATEAKIPELADAVIDVSETGTALRNNGLRLLAVVRTCGPQLIANTAALADPGRRRIIQGVARLLRSVATASSRTLLTIRVDIDYLDAVRGLMPAGSWQVGQDITDSDTVVMQGVFDRTGLAEKLDELLIAGAIDVIESGPSRLLTRFGS